MSTRPSKSAGECAVAELVPPAKLRGSPEALRTRASRPRAHETLKNTICRLGMGRAAFRITVAHHVALHYW